MPMALVSVSYLALAAAIPGKLYAQSAPQAPEAGKTEAPASPPSAPAEAPASSAKPEAAPSSPAPAEKKDGAASDAKSSDAPLSPVTIYPPREKPQPPVTQSREAPLPPVTIYPPRPKPQAKPTVQSAPVAQPTPASHARRAGRPVKPTTATAAVSAASVANAMQAAIQAAWPASQTQAGKTGEVGVYQNSTSAATKINTPIVNIPQSLSVVTKEFIADNAFQNITDVTRYVPGVAVHQGEGNRDELIIRGVDSSANFFVNGSAMTCRSSAISTTPRASKS
jgi:TonB-dependent Receptor Plug Domain